MQHDGRRRGERLQPREADRVQAAPVPLQRQQEGGGEGGGLLAPRARPGRRVHPGPRPQDLPVERRPVRQG